MSHFYTEKIKMLYEVARCQKKAILAELSQLQI